MKQGLLLAQSIGCNRIIVNPDNMEAITMMWEGGHSSVVAAMVFDDFFHLVSEFSKVIFDRTARLAACLSVYDEQTDINKYCKNK
jgi:hypothetical protein